MVCGALLALLVAAPVASADSIAYVKGGDVYLSTSDGSRQYRVTTTGGYSDVSQADDGTMIGLYGVRLHRLDRQGRVLADFDTPVSDTRPAPAKTFYGPFDPAISPDGTKVAYTYYWMTQSQSPTCFPPTCVTTINEGGTGYSWADRQTGWDDPALGKHSGWRNPSWIDNDNVMISDPTHALNYDVILDTISDGDSGNLVKGWFSDTADGNPHMSGGDVSRDRTKLAFATGENDSTLTVYSVPSFPTVFKDGDAPVSSRPGICYRYSGPAGQLRHADLLARRLPARLGRGRRHQGRQRPEPGRRLHARRRLAEPADADPGRLAARLGPGRRARRSRRQRRRPRGQRGQGEARARRSPRASPSRSPCRRPAASPPRRPTAASRSPPAASASRPARPRSSCASPAAPARRSTTPAASSCASRSRSRRPAAPRRARRSALKLKR